MLLSGREIAQRIFDETKKYIATHGITPGLAVILCGENPASGVYVQRKISAAHAVGIQVTLLKPTHPTTESLVANIQALNARADIHAILVQLPLPDTVDTNAVIATIDPRKDVDGFHPQNIAACEKNETARLPVLIDAIKELLEATHEPLHGKHAVIVGKSDVFTTPLKHFLETRGLTVVWVRPDSVTLENTCKTADVLIVAAGIPHLIQAPMVAQGSIIIDVGFTRGPDGTVQGDVNGADVAPHAKWITPTPGGVGPVTIAVVMRTTAHLAGQFAHTA